MSKKHAANNVKNVVNNAVSNAIRSEMKTEEFKTLEKNWKELVGGVESILVGNRNQFLSLFEKDFDKILKRVNQGVVRLNAALSKYREGTDLSKKEEVEKASEIGRMESEGGAGFINTLPHEGSPAETSNASEYHH